MNDLNRKAILLVLSERDEEADICTDSQGNPEPDTDLRDYENVHFDGLRLNDVAHLIPEKALGERRPCLWKTLGDRQLSLSWVDIPAGAGTAVRVCRQGCRPGTLPGQLTVKHVLLLRLRSVGAEYDLAEIQGRRDIDRRAGSPV